MGRIFLAKLGLLPSFHVLTKSLNIPYILAKNTEDFLDISAKIDAALKSNKKVKIDPNVISEYSTGIAELRSLVNAMTDDCSGVITFNNIQTEGDFFSVNKYLSQMNYIVQCVSLSGDTHALTITLSRQKKSGDRKMLSILTLECFLGEEIFCNSLTDAAIVKGLLEAKRCGFELLSSIKDSMGYEFPILVEYQEEEVVVQKKIKKVKAYPISDHRRNDFSIDF